MSDRKEKVEITCSLFFIVILLQNRQQTVSRTAKNIVLNQDYASMYDPTIFVR